ncbi:hypothetical protein LB521_04485 [Mesorhizobium sp. BR-1-1-8]|uniref:head-tail connector protein n=1 Tax=Mesorhizobium sp. BR-1-1-8 TaxID=2876659 RepID=UPI001CCA1BE3|nr:hypothetical protein [Mesorhizobium sp. BR-1-1-8]MBZ9980404.1 hypothetical protein [Mesorhizobium sp. BR-1-1-8]
MWYPATVTVAATDEPIRLVEAKRHVHAEDYTDDDAELALLISSARNHVEKYCNTRFATQTVAVKCDCFGDMARLSEAPVQSVTSIVYVDAAGATQTLADTVYELRADGLEAAIVLRYGQSWPAIQPSSRISVTAVVGYEDAPPSVKHAILLFLAGGYEMRENASGDAWTTFDCLLSNHRRGI